VTRTLRTSTRYAVPLLAFSALLLALAAPAAAAPAGQQNCGPSLAFLGAESPQALLFGAAPMAKKGDSIPDPGAQSPCSALCGDGSYVTCWGSYCYAYDHNCPEEGHCYGSSTGTLYCPSTCPSACQDSTYCDVKDGTACSGTPHTSDCTFRSGGCGSCICSDGRWNCTN